MSFPKSILCFWAFCVISAPTLADPSPECIATDFSQISDIIENCDELVINNITVPGGNPIEFRLREGAKLTFEGRITFEHYQFPEWGHYLMHFYGNNITVEGAPGSILDGKGELYWDGMGDQGVPKPYFIGISVNNSVFRNINLLNCPHHCTLVGGTDGVLISGWNIDCSYGDDRGGHNTDGFDVIGGNNVEITDSTVVNQDDCVAVNQGFNMSFSGLRCTGSHGVSISVGFSNTSYLLNTVKNVTYSNCTLTHSANAIHIKTHSDGGPGEITDVTYENIAFTDITNFAVSIQQNYPSGGVLKGNVPITNLKLQNIIGSLSPSSNRSIPVSIICAEDACKDWNWSDILILGGAKPSSCNYQPNGYEC